jgi:hypothetical protein
MRAGARRYLVIIGLLCAGVAISWGQRWTAGSGEVVPDTPAAGTSEAAEAEPWHTYFLDVEGWYRITPYETAVRSRYDLTGNSSGAIAAALPAALGAWQQVGADEYIGDDPAVVAYLNHPTMALQRTYRGPDGQRLVLAIVGNEGEDSFLLFSHTPETCYPGRLWQMLDNRQESALVGDQPVHARFLRMEHQETGERLLVLFWYLWDNAQRDARDGVLSMRLNLFVAPGESEEDVLARGWDFFRLLFPSALPWERF